MINSMADSAAFVWFGILINFRISFERGLACYQRLLRKGKSPPWSDLFQIISCKSSVFSFVAGDVAFQRNVVSFVDGNTASIPPYLIRRFLVLLSNCQDSEIQQKAINLQRLSRGSETKRPLSSPFLPKSKHICLDPIPRQTVESVHITKKSMDPDIKHILSHLEPNDIEDLCLTSPKDDDEMIELQNALKVVSQPIPKSQLELLSPKKCLSQPSPTSQSNMCTELQHLSEPKQLPELQHLSEPKQLPELQPLSEPKQLPELQPLSEPRQLPELLQHDVLQLISYFKSSSFLEVTNPALLDCQDMITIMNRLRPDLSATRKFVKTYVGQFLVEQKVCTRNITALLSRCLDVEHDTLSNMIFDILRHCRKQIIDGTAKLVANSSTDLNGLLCGFGDFNFWSEDVTAFLIFVVKDETSSSEAEVVVKYLTDFSDNKSSKSCTLVMKLLSAHNQNDTFLNICRDFCDRNTSFLKKALVQRLDDFH